MPEEILIEISTDGRIKIEGNGFVGPDCRTLTADLEQALGDVEAVEKKPEYHRQRQIHKTAGGR